MITRVSTGLSQLDQALDGGYPKGSVISLFGKTTMARKRLALQFLNHSSAAQLYINTRDPISVIQQEAQQFGTSLESTVFLDAVHWRSKRVNPKLNTEADYEVNNLTDLNALLAKIMEATKNTDIDKILFDSPSSLLLYSTPGKEQVYKFFELLTAYVRSKGITLCYTLEDGVHNSQMVSTMHFLSDGVITSGLDYEGGNPRPYYQILQMSLTNYWHGKIEIDS